MFHGRIVVSILVSVAAVQRASADVRTASPQTQINVGAQPERPAQSWKAGWVQALAGSNPASSAAPTRGNAATRCSIPGLPTGHSLSLGLNAAHPAGTREPRRTVTNAGGRFTVPIRRGARHESGLAAVCLRAQLNGQCPRRRRERWRAPVENSPEPHGVDRELDTLIPNSPNQPYDMHEVISRVLDDGDFQVHALFAPKIMVGSASMILSSRSSMIGSTGLHILRQTGTFTSIYSGDWSSWIASMSMDGRSLLAFW